MNNLRVLAISGATPYFCISDEKGESGHERNFIGCRFGRRNDFCRCAGKTIDKP